jgi:hypothetical protein
MASDRPGKPRPCGNPRCSCSTGIHEGLTFGSGRLDSLGYWSKPCHVCARANDADQKDQRARVARDLVSHGKSKRYVRRYIATAEWLWIESWPFARQAKGVG